MTPDTLETLLATAPSNDSPAEVTSGNPIVYMNGRRTVPTLSSVLVSSSRWLNEPAIREWIATESLRKNGADYPLLYGTHDLITAIDRVQDRDRVEKLIRAERAQ
jgi:hypothetical protein